MKNDGAAGAAPMKRSRAPAVPEQAVAQFCTGLDQAALDWSCEARIVELDGEIMRSGLARCGFPGCADLVAGFLDEDPEVGSFLAALSFDGLEFHVRSECERLECARVAVLRCLEVADDRHVFVSFG